MGYRLTGYFTYRNSTTLGFLGAFLTGISAVLFVVALVIFSELDAPFKVPSIYNGILTGTIISMVGGTVQVILGVLDFILIRRNKEELTYILRGENWEEEDIESLPQNRTAQEPETGPTAIPSKTEPVILMLAKDSQGKWTYKGVEGHLSQNQEEEDKTKV